MVIDAFLMGNFLVKVTLNLNKTLTFRKNHSDCMIINIHTVNSLVVDHLDLDIAPSIDDFFSPFNSLPSSLNTSLDVSLNFIRYNSNRVSILLRSVNGCFISSMVLSIFISRDSTVH